MLWVYTVEPMCRFKIFQNDDCHQGLKSDRCESDIP